MINNTAIWLQQITKSFWHKSHTDTQHNPLFALFQQIRDGKSDMAVVYFGSKSTSNELNEQYSDEYQNISVAEPVSLVSMNHYKSVHALNVQEMGSGTHTDLFGAIMVAADMLEKHVGKKKTLKKRIFIVTDASGYELVEDETKLIIPIAQRKNIQFDVIGVDFDESVIDGDSDIRVKNESGEQKEMTPKQVNEQFLQSLCEMSGGIVTYPSQAIAMLSQPRPKTMATTPSFRCNLELGETIQIPIFMYKKTDVPKFTPAVTKISTMAAEANIPDRQAKVKRIISNYSIDNPDEEVTELVTAYRFGRDIIPIHDADKNAMEYKCDKCFQILGFSDQSAIPRHNFMSTSYCVMAKHGDSVANQSLTTLIRALAQLDQVAIVRYCYRAGCSVNLGVLHPVTKPDYDYLVLNILPYADNIRPYTFKSLATNHTPEQLQTAEDLIRSMDLMDAEEDEQGNKVEAMKPTRMPNPAIEYYLSCLHHRSLYPNDPLPARDDNIFRYCYPEKSAHSFYPKLVEKSATALEDFEKQFPLKRVEKTSLKRKYWFAAGNEISLESYNNTNSTAVPIVNDEVIAQQAKRLKPTDDDDDPVSNPMAFRNLFNDKADDVGTTNPVNDFNEMVGRRDVDLVDKAVSQMIDVINKLIRESIDDQYYQKCQACIEALRSGCIKEEESDKFNNFLRDLKRQYSSPTNSRFEFWDRYIVQKNITLISDEEADDIDDVTAQMAKDFLHKQLEAAPVESVESPKLTGDEEEDLFGDLE